MKNGPSAQREAIPEKQVHHSLDTKYHLTPFYASQEFPMNSAGKQASDLPYPYSQKGQASEQLFSPTSHLYSSGDYQRSGPISKQVFPCVIHVYNCQSFKRASSQQARCSYLCNLNEATVNSHFHANALTPGRQDTSPFLWCIYRIY